MKHPAIFPFERPFEEVEAKIDQFVGTMIVSLESSFLTMPKGKGFVEYDVFEAGYETLKRATVGFTEFTCENLTAAVRDNAIVFVVLRAMLGFSPPEWAYLAAEHSGLRINQGFARRIDRNVRLKPMKGLTINPSIEAMINVSCELLRDGAKDVGSHVIHRLDKADTKSGIASIMSVSKMGVPYAMLLYERLLGRPFASHRDSVSELIGDCMEAPLEEVLSQAGVSYRKTKRAERVEGFEQAPDFIVPDEFNPRVVLEAKITEDDGTARDKVTRIQHLATLSRNRVEKGLPAFELVACIDGRGFGIRREDMKKIIRATKGKVFTLGTLDRLVENTSIKDYRSV